MAGATQRTKHKAGAKKAAGKPASNEPTGADSNNSPRRSRAARISVPALDLSESRASGVLRPKSGR